MKIIKSIVFGAPGSGKGTISQRIIKHFQIEHISTGDILRTNIAKKTDLGKHVESFVSTGKLVPDDIMNSMVLSELKNVSVSCLLDGYPRTLSQAKNLSRSIDINLVMNLDVPFEVIIDRLKSRWIHLSSGRVYNIGFNDPKTPGLDDVTGEKLIQREDDKPEVVEKRLKTYSDTATPVLEFFKSLGVLETFKGNTSNEIWEKLYPFLCTKLTQKV